MGHKGQRRLAWLACMAAYVAMMGAAQAQYSDYPTSKSIRMSRGQHGYFDVGPGETQPIVNIKEPEVYRICIEGEKATVVADGNSVPLDHGDCYDVEAKDIKIQNKGGDEETEGTYHRRWRRGGPPDQRY